MEGACLEVPVKMAAYLFSWTLRFRSWSGQTVKHDIQLEDKISFKEPYRHIPPALFQEVESI